MASRYWVGGTGTWNASSTAHWSATSGGSSGASVPGASDDVFFNSNSGGGTVTLSSPTGVQSVDCTGFTGTWSGSSNLNIKQGLTLGSGMTNGWTGDLNFNGTSGGYNITTNGKHVQSISFTGVGGQWALLDDLTLNSGGQILHTGGTIVFNGKTVTGGDSFSSIGSGTRAIDLSGPAPLYSGSSLIFTKSWTIWGSNISVYQAGLHGSTSTITLNGADAVFTGGGFTYDYVSLTGPGKALIYDANTFLGLLRQGTPSKTDSIFFDANQSIISILDGSGIHTIQGFLGVSGNSVTNRLWVGSTVVGVQRTIYMWVGGSPGPAVFGGMYADIQDLDPTGTIPWDLTTASSGDCGNNSNITFTSGQPIYWVGGAGSFSDNSHWANVSGGIGGSERIPLPQDSTLFDANSFSTDSDTVNFDMPRVGGFDWTGATHYPVLNNDIGLNCYGSMTFIADMSISGGVGSFTYCGRATETLTSNGVQALELAYDCGGGTVQLGDNGAFTNITAWSGTFDANNKNVTIGGTIYLAETYNTRTLTMGSGTWTLTQNGGYLVQLNMTNLTVNAGTSTMIVSSTATSNKTFQCAGATFYNLQVNGATNAGQVKLVGAGTFNNITLNPKANFAFPAGATTTVASFTATGTSGNVITIASSTSGSAATLSCASGTISCNYISLKDNHATGGATFHAGANSTNVSGNTGWSFP